MNVSFLCGRETVNLDVPDNTIVYESSFPAPEGTATDSVQAAIDSPVGTADLSALLAKRSKGDVVIVVSDITRPIPYYAFLPQMLKYIEDAGVAKAEILILVATGMHRRSSREELVQMFGEEIVDSYRIVDHEADSADDIVPVEGRSWSGNVIEVNRYLAEAGFKIVTGLVEPHFMAGFSGGRKAVCPGLSSLGTVQNFHGYEFLADKNSRNGNLTDNPLHNEALSVAHAVGIDFSLNVVLDGERQIVRSFAGDLDGAHRAACEFVSSSVCPPVSREADVVVTSSGGYPLDATFYQCVKGMVSCLPAVRRDGEIISFAGCEEGVGSSHYRETMFRYSGNWQGFLQDIQQSSVVIKDQWQLQMQCRVLEKVGQGNLSFVTPGISQEELGRLSVTGHAVGADGAERKLQELVDNAAKDGRSIAVFPEGPYCAPTPV